MKQFWIEREDKFICYSFIVQMHSSRSWSFYLFNLNLDSRLPVTVSPPQASLESEKQRADDCERKYNEAQTSGEERRKKLEETEKKVSQLQENLTR